MIKFAAALAFLMLNFYTYNYLARDAVIPPRTSFDEFPLKLDPWSCHQRAQVSQDVRKTLGATDMFICDYRRPGALISLYVGYHASQVREEGGGAGENSIHPPVHCLPGSGWDIIKNETVKLEMPGLPGRGGTAKRLVIARGNLRQLVYYWYQSRGRMLSEDWKKIIFVGWDRATKSRTDGALVRFTVPIVREDEGIAQEIFDDLVPQIVALLPEYVPK